MYQITHYYTTKIKPLLNFLLVKILYSSKRINIGKNVRFDSFPRIIVDKNCKLNIGNNTEFRRNVEIRSHGVSKINIGSNVKIDRGVRILAANESVININNHAKIGLYSVLNGGDSIKIGEKTLISGFVYLQTSMHNYTKKDAFVQDQGFTHAPVSIEKDSWLGTHVVIMPGVSIGESSIVGSNAVVTKNVEKFNVVAGIPAKTIKNRL